MGSAVTITPDPVSPPNVSVTPDAAKPSAAGDLADLIGSAAKSLAKVSGPNVIYEALRKAAPHLNLPPALGMPNQNEVMQAGLLSMIPEAEGEALPARTGEAAATDAAAKTTSSEIPAVAQRVGKVLLNRIPGVKLAGDLLDAVKGPTPEPPPVPTPAVPETDGIPWGTKGPGTLEQRGKMIPTEAAATPAASVQPNVTITPDAVPAPVKPALVAKQLNDALGGQPLVPGVSLRNQPAAQATAAGKLPAGFTAVDSSVLKGYKYDPDAQELTAITKNGQSYTHGEVSPDQFASFEAAPSKGSAWTSVIRDNSPLVKKNGLPVKPVAATNPQTITPPAGHKPSPEITLPAGQTESDLSPLLQESLKRARAMRAAKMQANP